MNDLKKTPLYPKYQEFGGKIVPFAGYALPVSFAGIKAEHQTIRENVGVFDVSHMGIFYVSGSDAESFLNRVTSNNVSKLSKHKVQYSAFCNANGGVVDDILVYKLDEELYQIIVNAANIQKDFEWIVSLNAEGVTIKNASDDVCIVALQGPKAVDVAQKVSGQDLSDLGYYESRVVSVSGNDVLMSRTGYTGEDGFEFFPVNELAVQVWDALFEAGAEFGIQPVGLGARDTLRLEAGFSLYGQELNDERSILSSGLGWITDMSKEDFVGKSALLDEHKNGSRNKIVGLELIDKGIPRIGCPVAVNGTIIGEVTSGSVIPTTAKAIAMAYIDAAYAKPGTEIEVIIRDASKKARVVSRRFKK